MNNRANGIWMQKKFPDKQQNSLTFPDIPVKNKISDVKLELFSKSKLGSKKSIKTRNSFLIVS